MNSIWILARREDHGDRGIVTELAYTGPYGTDSCPAFETKEAAMEYQEKMFFGGYWKPVEMPVK